MSLKEFRIVTAAEVLAAVEWNDEWKMLAAAYSELLGANNEILKTSIWMIYLHCYLLKTFLSTYELEVMLVISYMNFKLELWMNYHGYLESSNCPILLPSQIAASLNYYNFYYQPDTFRLIKSKLLKIMFPKYFAVEKTDKYWYSLVIWVLANT